MKETRHLSIVIVVHNEAELLQQNLPQFLSIAQEANAEVVIVDDMSSDETPDILKQFCQQNEHLYTTFLPHSLVPNPSRMRLAMSIGVKAAKGDRIILADLQRPPISLGWLTGLDCGEAAAVFTNRKGNKVTHIAVDDVDELMPMILKTERRGGHLHESQWNKLRRGAYEAISVKREHAIDVVRLFDQNVDGIQLLTLSLKI